jgi:hypothetical protein
MIPLETLDYEKFSALTDHTFVVTTGSGEIELKLGAVRLLGSKREGASRDPFSLSFLGPQGLRLEQSIYRFNCDALGETELFITQVGDGAKGSEFEAIFT